MNYASKILNIIQNATDKEKALEAIQNVIGEVKKAALKEVDVQAYQGNPFVLYDILDEFNGTIYLTYMDEEDAKKDLQKINDMHDAIKKIIINDIDKTIHPFIQALALKRLIIQKRTVENCDLSLDYNPGQIKEILKKPVNEKIWIIWLSNQIGFDKFTHLDSSGSRGDDARFYGHSPTNDGIQEEDIGTTIQEIIEPMLEAIENAPVSPMGKQKEIITLDGTFNMIARILTQTN